MNGNPCKCGFMLHEAGCLIFVDAPVFQPLIFMQILECCM